MCLFTFTLLLSAVYLSHFTCLSFAYHTVTQRLSAFMAHYHQHISVIMHLWLTGQNLATSHYYLQKYLTHKAYTLNSPSHKNLLHKTHALWWVVKLLLRSDILCRYSFAGCVCVCVKLTNFIKGLSEVVQVVAGNLCDVTLHCCPLRWNTWNMHTDDEHTCFWILLSTRTKLI